MHPFKRDKWQNDLRIRANDISGPGMETDSNVLWQISDQDAHRNKTKPLNNSRRYFGLRCKNCNERGHIVADCPLPTKCRSCYFCGMKTHLSRFCREAQQLKNFENRTRSSECDRCNLMGHTSTCCPERWRQFHLTIEPGPIISKLSLRRTEGKSCYNCWQTDHFGYECPMMKWQSSGHWRNRKAPERNGICTAPTSICYDTWIENYKAKL